MTATKFTIYLAAIFGAVWFVRSVNVTLSRTSRYELEGQSTSFECTVTMDPLKAYAPYYIIWSLDTNEISFFSTVSTAGRLNVTLYRNMSGAVLMCKVYPYYKINGTWTIDVMYPPSHVTLEVNSTHLCENDATCSAYVTLRDHYRFTCVAFGSNPASNITWLINTRNRWGTTQREISAVERSWSRQAENGTDWDASSHINLQILPEDRDGSIMCRVTFPEDSAVFREIVMNLKVLDDFHPPSHVTLDVNSTRQFCESDTTCSADVTLGHHYRFTCNASGSDPVSNITWLINTRDRWGTTYTEIPALESSWSRQAETGTDWDTSSHINLQILPEDRDGSIMCRVTFPENSAVFREIVMNLKVLHPDNSQNSELVKWVLVVCIPAVAIVIACVVMVMARKHLHRSKRGQPRPAAADPTSSSSHKEGSQSSEEDGLYEKVPAVHYQKSGRSRQDQGIRFYHTHVKPRTIPPLYFEIVIDDNIFQ